MMLQQAYLVDHLIQVEWMMLIFSSDPACQNEDTMLNQRPHKKLIYASLYVS